MKSEVKLEQKLKYEYPKIMIAEDGVIVLFLEDRVGFVVGNPREFNPIGYYSDWWIMDRFKDFTGTVTLSN